MEFWIFSFSNNKTEKYINIVFLHLNTSKFFSVFKTYVRWENYLCQSKERGPKVSSFWEKDEKLKIDEIKEYRVGENSTSISHRKIVIRLEKVINKQKIQKLRTHFL